MSVLLTHLFFFCLFGQRFLDNPQADSRQSSHVGVLWFRMCLLPFWRLAAPGGGKRGNGFFVKNLCRMRMASLCQFYTDAHVCSSFSLIFLLHVNLLLHVKYTISTGGSATANLAPCPNDGGGAYHVHRSARRPGILAYRTLLLISIRYMSHVFCDR